MTREMNVLRGQIKSLEILENIKFVLVVNRLWPKKSICAQIVTLTGL